MGYTYTCIYQPPVLFSRKLSHHYLQQLVRLQLFCGLVLPSSSSPVYSNSESLEKLWITYTVIQVIQKISDKRLSQYTSCWNIGDRSFILLTWFVYPMIKQLSNTFPCIHPHHFYPIHTVSPDSVTIFCLGDKQVRKSLLIITLSVSVFIKSDFPLLLNWHYQTFPFQINQSTFLSFFKTPCLYFLSVHIVQFCFFINTCLVKDTFKRVWHTHDQSILF